MPSGGVHPITHSGLPVLVASSRSYKSAAEVAGREQDDYPTRGCFGGPASLARDAGIDAALLSKAVGRPVRVQGMRFERTLALSCEL
jgi:hypothetical protein